MPGYHRRCVTSPVQDNSSDQMCRGELVTIALLTGLSGMTERTSCRGRVARQGEFRQDSRCLSLYEPE